MVDYVTIVSFVCHDDITVDLEFSDGTHQLVDIGAFIRSHPHPQYNKYLKPSNFRKCRLEYGNVCWVTIWNSILKTCMRMRFLPDDLRYEKQTRMVR